MLGPTVGRLQDQGQRRIHHCVGLEQDQMSTSAVEASTSQLTVQVEKVEEEGTKGHEQPPLAPIRPFWEALQGHLIGMTDWLTEAHARTPHAFDELHVSEWLGTLFSVTVSVFFA